MHDAGERDFGSEGSRNAGGAGTYGAGSSYAPQQTRKTYVRYQGQPTAASAASHRDLSKHKLYFEMYKEEISDYNMAYINVV